MIALKQFSKEQKFDFGMNLAIIGLAILIGVIVGMNEEWFLARNFTAGYMAGSLLAALLLFALYRTIVFFVNLTKK
ncbi:hypothetical protein CR203_19905 [Salipaludibacillus neizhouensis]|uniref:Uncharacterized protein n=1 Tax=Salipaludibacillus neizhouensis TaxID=885475 RepID=A0A3A9K2W8_9BACI|nr:hypothetical protein [Salipaludibacillus neizhouensis]RKL65588.1 hypothetical protein CR203_19905 [Salipaludibacillus neizhouensis]